MGFANNLLQKGYAMNTAAHKKQVLLSKALLQLFPTLEITRQISS
jgi:hypothetical protein